MDKNAFFWQKGQTGGFACFLALPFAPNLDTESKRQYKSRVFSPINCFDNKFEMLP
jgi:hypothetical protein